MISIIDAAQTLEPFAEDIAGKGVKTVFRYYNHKNVTLKTKRLELEEANTLCAHGISLGVVFQQRGRNIEDFEGESGARDAGRALELAARLGQTSGSAIYFAVDWDFIKTKSLSVLAAYFAQINKSFDGNYKVGAYGSGKVLELLQANGLVDYCWLAQARGWSGYKPFLQSGDWTMMQQMPAIWPGAGFSYDGNILNSSTGDVGQFVLGTASNEPSPSGSPLIMQVNARSGLRLRSGPVFSMVSFRHCRMGRPFLLARLKIIGRALTWKGMACSMAICMSVISRHCPVDCRSYPQIIILPIKLHSKNYRLAWPKLPAINTTLELFFITQVSTRVLLTKCLGVLLL